MRKTTLVHSAKAALLAFVLSPAAFATLISVGPVAQSGTGLGAVQTLVTFQNDGTEVGAVGVNGSGAAAVGSAYTYFGTTTATGETTHEQAIFNVYSPTTLGLGGATTFSNIVLIFNGNEVRSMGQESIRVEEVALNLYSPTGMILASFDTAAGITYADVAPGTGNAGYGYQLDAVQAAQANAVWAANQNLLIGAAIRVSMASDGPETLYISTLGGGTTPGVPDSGATAALLGIGLIALGTIRRFLR